MHMQDDSRLARVLHEECIFLQDWSSTTKGGGEGGKEYSNQQSLKPGGVC